MAHSPASPLIVQSDGTLLLDERQPGCESAREWLRSVAELRKRPGTLHTYKMTPLTMWQAAATGLRAEDVIEALRSFARYGVPALLEQEIRLQMDRYGRLRLLQDEEVLILAADSSDLLAQVCSVKAIKDWLLEPAFEQAVAVRPEARGWLKRELSLAGYPVVDEAGYRSGESLPIAWSMGGGEEANQSPLRPYQQEAVNAFVGSRQGEGGSGVVVLPCGAGKTWVGMGVMAKLGCETLVLTPNTTSVTQWIRELLRHTTLSESDIGAYTGQEKRVRPVTVATYQVLTHRSGQQEVSPHWRLFQDRNWGLIIYDEVHLLPAPVFRLTAELQATRRLGLTATLVREDGREGDVFALVGPKKYEQPWKSLEQHGWIAEASCHEMRVPMDDSIAGQYAAASARSRSRIAGENPGKTEVVRRLLARHAGEPTLIIGQYLDQLRDVAGSLNLPLVTGEVSQAERELLYDKFNRGELKTLALSKVANFAVDLPDAAVAIQLSGSFGSRQEEAQRLGRILRPKRDGGGATFYSLVSEGTDEVEYARRRQRFLLEQGYAYSILPWMEGETGTEEEGGSAE